MPLADGVRRWSDVVSLLLFSVLWAALGWGVVRDLLTDGPAAVDTLADGAHLVMVLLTLATTAWVIRQTVLDDTE
jgi:hypothetical protein